MSIEENGDNGSAGLRIARGFEHLVHWWREPIAGIASLAIGCFDTWKFGRNDGLTASLDEVLIVSGIILIAGSRRLFGAMPPGGANGKGNGDT